MNLGQKFGFSALQLSPALLQVLEELGFKAPTPIQEKSIPLLLQGKDVIGQAQTGSGKTAAFALPLLQKIDLAKSWSNRQGNQIRRVQALILCPTRELCAQSVREIQRLGRKHPGLQVIALSGGMPMGPQLGALERGVHIVVGTPGRVLDHIKRGSLDLAELQMLVLDEADRMLEMGFQDDMKKILAGAPAKRQTVLFSATFPKTIETLSLTYQKSPVRVTVEEETNAVASIRQVVFEAAMADRMRALFWVVEQNKVESVIIFCNFKTSCVQLAEELSRCGVSVGVIHGDLEQRDRDRVMAKFRNGSLQFLVATDVAARGIDIPNLDAVINFELPAQARVYVHRIGRTGRAGQKGLAISFYTSREKSKLQAIEKFTGTELSRKTLSNLSGAETSDLQQRMPKKALMKTLFISGGRKEKMRPGDVLGALTGEACGLKAQDIGKIEIHDHFTYVALSDHVFSVALAKLREGKIKGKRFRIEAVR